MNLQELETLVKRAAGELIEASAAPRPVAVVLPRDGATDVLRIPDFPVDDAERHEAMELLADAKMRADNSPCWGFVSEAEVNDEPVVLAAWGARGHDPQIAVAGFDGNDLQDWSDAEALEVSALAWLHPLQIAAQQATAEDPSTGLVDLTAHQPHSDN